MPKARERVGESYGRLTVSEKLEHATQFNKGGKWKCICSCGNTIEVNGYALHDRKSCGCLVKESKGKAQYTRRVYDRVTITAEYLNHQNNARQRGWIPMPKEDWLVIVKKACFYCGDTDIRNRANVTSYMRTRGISLRDGDMVKYAVSINGIDRINSEKGYTIDNSVPCCGVCNRMKNNYTQELFFEKINKIYIRHLKEI